MIRTLTTLALVLGLAVGCTQPTRGPAPEEVLSGVAVSGFRGSIELSDPSLYGVDMMAAPGAPIVFVPVEVPAAEGETPILGEPVRIETVECSVQEVVGWLAGPDATDCGHVTLGEDRSAADACAAEAFAQGDTFVARYEVQGYDSAVLEIVAGNADGHVFVAMYDSAPCGAVGACTPTYHVERCVAPEIDADGHLDCTSRVGWFARRCG